MSNFIKSKKILENKYIDSNDYYNVRYTVRLQKSGSILKKFQQYVDNEIINALPKISLGKAFAYAQKLLPYMRTFLTNGYLGQITFQIIFILSFQNRT